MELTSDIVAHEMKSFVSSTKGLLILLEQTELTALQRNYVQLLQNSNENILSFLNNHLYDTRAVNNVLELLEDDFNIHLLVKEICQIYVMHKPDVKIVYQIMENVPTRIYTDQQKLKQILINLMNNAIKFTNKGFIYLTVDVIDEENEKRLVFGVQDTGPGVEESIRHHLFEKFITSKTGSGLGLYICDKLVKLMGGDIGYMHQDDGAFFHFFIPLKKGPR